jgi:hypothetical protein
MRKNSLPLVRQPDSEESSIPGKRAPYHRMFSELDFTAQRAFAEVIASPQFSSLIQVRTDEARPREHLLMGPYTTAYLEGELGSEEARQAVAEILHLKTDLVADLENSELSKEPKFAKRIHELCTLTAQLLLAVAPKDLTPMAYLTHGIGLVWMFAVDDAVDKVTARINDLGLPGCRKWYPFVVRHLMEHYIVCLRAALGGQAYPAEPTNWRDEVLHQVDVALNPLERGVRWGLGRYMGKGMPKLYALGRLLHRCGCLLRMLFARARGRQPEALSSAESQYLISLADRFVAILSASLLKKVDEVEAAPASVEEYYIRHSRTGGIHMSFEFSFLIRGLDQDLRLEALSSLPVDKAIDHAYRCVLLANEYCFFRDIGKAEESIVAVMIVDEMRKAGVSQLPFLGTQRAHGQVLEQYGHTRYAFAVVKDIFLDFRRNLLALIDECQALVTHAPAESVAVARCVAEVLTKWAMGYHLVNPTCSRYGASYGVVETVLHDDYDEFQRRIQNRTGEMNLAPDRTGEMNLAPDRTG